MESTERKLKKTKTALAPGFREAFSSLKDRKRGATHEVSTIHAELAFALVEREILKLPTVPLSQLALINRELSKWLRKRLASKNPKFMLSSATAEGLNAVLLKAVNRIDPEDGRRLLSLLPSLLQSSITTAEMSESPIAWARSMDVLSDVANKTKNDLRRVAANKRLAPLFGVLSAGMFSALEKAVLAGDSDSAESLLKRLQYHEELRKRIKPHLQQLLNTRSVDIPEQAQGWLSSQVGETSSIRPVFANPSNAPEIASAASLLIFLWDVKNLSPQMAEAFERFASLSEKQFYLFVKGTVGETLAFDRRLHEYSSGTPQRSEGLVVVRRPRVEYVNPPHSRIVVKSTVQSVEGY